jgi:hypothetical protein
MEVEYPDFKDFFPKKRSAADCKKDFVGYEIEEIKTQEMRIKDIIKKAVSDMKKENNGD